MYRKSNETTGSIAFFFKADSARGRYDVFTMYRVVPEESITQYQHRDKRSTPRGLAKSLKIDLISIQRCRQSIN